MSASSHSGVSSIFPTAIFVQGGHQQTLSLNHTPYTVGRKIDCDLVIADPRVSREHASIVLENGEFYVVDNSTKHGTFLNGQKVDRHKLQRNDRLEFGARDVAYLIFHPLHTSSNTAREFLSQIPGIQIAPEASDIEKLTLFMEAARKLNTIGVLDEILVTLLEATLNLTHAERGYIFLRDPDGTLALAAGRNSKGEPLLDDKTISRSVLEGALTSNSEYLVNDTSQMLDVKGRQSIVAFDLRTVICMALRKPLVQTTRADQPAGGEAMGVLYVDSGFASRDITKVSHDLLRDIATQAAQLIENARLLQAEVAGRRYQQELSIAASISQRLLGAVDLVHFSVISNSVVLPGTTFVINVWAHLAGQREEVIRRAQETSNRTGVSLQSKGPVQVTRGTVLLVRLQIENLVIEDPEDAIPWEGEIANATFWAEVPKTASKGQKRALGRVFVGGLEIAKIHFVVEVGQKISDECQLPAREELHRTAFASYANADRDAVLARIQGMQKAAPSLDVFLDVLKLRSGEDWEKRLWKEIPSKDVFYLFWSEGASQSNWVEKEWRCALETKGLDFIDPVPLVSPQSVPPPPELASKHFNDWVLAFTRSKHCTEPSG
jgi:predicted component of type VI protein secretion system